MAVEVRAFPFPGRRKPFWQTLSRAPPLDAIERLDVPDFRIRVRRPIHGLLMWTCPKCREQHADHFSSCWKCAGMEAPPRAFPVVTSPVPNCLRCNVPLQFVGTKQFQEGGLAAEIGALFVNCERLEIQVCPRCGHLEFFAGAKGEPTRSAVPPPELSRPASTPDGLLWEGNAMAARGEVEAAVACFEQVSIKFPGTNYARDAEKHIREIRDKLGM